MKADQRAQSARPQGMSLANLLREAKGGACPPLLRSYEGLKKHREKIRHCSNFTDRLFVKHCHCERSEAIFFLPGDCFVAPLHAMT